MKRIGLLLTLLACACGKPFGDAAQVAVELAPGTASACVLVSVSTDVATRNTRPILVDGRQRLIVGVLRGELPATVRAEAAGFSDLDCLVPQSPPERADAVEIAFSATAVTKVTLTLTKRAPAKETGLCDNGLDDDNDGATDCVDLDCTGAACASGDVCRAGEVCTGGVCGGGGPLVCLTPPSPCFFQAGVCVASDGGCVYAPAPGNACDDNNPCTLGEQCDPMGACTGTPKICDTPGAQCRVALGQCVPDGGCEYAVDLGGACDDADTCTVGDQCGATGACAGLRVPCPDTECGTFAGACELDAGCTMTPRASGTACDAGVCNAFAGCVPRFPYAPSNFTEAQLPTFPSGATVLDCGQTVIDTGASGAPTVTNWCPGQPMFGSAPVAQAGGPDAVVLAFDSLDINAGGTLVVRGSRPAIIATRGRVSVLGRLVGEAGAVSCADGGVGGDGAAAVSNGGAGGGAYGLAGANGGASGYGVSGGGGGVPNGEPTLMPLRGGCPGGRGGDSSARAAAGGGGLQVSAGGDLTVVGIVTAPGEGGSGGQSGLVGTGANGGGSGGSVLLEGLTVTLVGTAAVAANGGGGGEGALGASGNPGAMGTASNTGAPGGTGGSGTGGNGGAGGAGTSGAGTGAGGWAGLGASGGGGGGSVGRVRINTALGCSIGVGVTISPSPTSNVTDGGCGS